MLVARERYANSLTLGRAKEIFNECISEWGEKQNFIYNPMVKHADVFMKPRVAYITEVLRQLAESSADSGMVAIVDHDLLPFIEHAWEKELPRELRSLSSLLAQPEAEAGDPKRRETYLEYVEKQVILDIVFEPFIQKSYIQYDVFPFTEQGFLGNETALLNVITFWKHYWHKYMDRMQEIIILEDEYEKFLQKQGVLIREEELE